MAERSIDYWYSSATQKQKDDTKMWKDDLKNYLSISKEGVPVDSLNEILDIDGVGQIPYKKLGFKHLNHFLYDCNDFLLLGQLFTGQLFLFTKQTEVSPEVAHIAQLVKGQERNKGTVRNPRPLRQQISYWLPLQDVLQHSSRNDKARDYKPPPKHLPRRKSGGGRVSKNMPDLQRYTSFSARPSSGHFHSQRMSSQSNTLMGSKRTEMDRRGFNSSHLYTSNKNASSKVENGNLRGILKNLGAPKSALTVSSGQKQEQMHMTYTATTVSNSIRVDGQSHCNIESSSNSHIASTNVGKIIQPFDQAARNTSNDSANEPSSIPSMYSALAQLCIVASKPPPENFNTTKTDSVSKNPVLPIPCETCGSKVAKLTAAVLSSNIKYKTSPCPAKEKSPPRVETEILKSPAQEVILVPPQINEISPAIPKLSPRSRSPRGRGRSKRIPITKFLQEPKLPGAALKPELNVKSSQVEGILVDSKNSVVQKETVITVRVSQNSTRKRSINIEAIQRVALGIKRFNDKLEERKMERLLHQNGKQNSVSDITPVARSAAADSNGMLIGDQPWITRFMKRKLFSLRRQTIFLYACIVVISVLHCVFYILH